jgi:WD40 repeat protein
MPYKGLVPFTDEDAPFFFGRDAERAIIAANVASARLTLLYGASGVGKTSVLGAGVLPDLREDVSRSVKVLGEPHFAVVSFQEWAPGSDPVEGLVEAVRNATSELVDAKLNPTPGWPRFAGILHAAAELINGKVLVILDQFEEYFLYRTREDGKGTFGYEFVSAMNEPDLRANVLVSMREDAVTKLGDRFQGEIAGLYDNYLRIEHLDLEAARDAIRKPIDRYNELAPPELQVRIEDALVEGVLGQLEAGRVVVGEVGLGSALDDWDIESESRIETPYLQLVMERLWQEDAASRSLRRQTLDDLGGAQEIVRTHLDKSLGTLSRPEKDVAARIFRHLVTPSGTKIALTKADLTDYARSPGEEQPPTEILSSLLDKLSSGDARILRSTEQGRYEIFHDVLAAPILDWRTRHDRERDARQQHDRRRRQRRRRAIVVVIPLLSLLVLTQFSLLVFALRERDSANKARAHLEALRGHELASRTLSAQARFRMDDQPDLGLLLAIEAIRAAETVDAQGTLLSGLQRFQRLKGFLRPLTSTQEPASVLRVAYAPDFEEIVAVDGRGRVLVWNAVTDQPVGSQVPTRSYGSPTSMALSPDGDTVAVGTLEGQIFTWDLGVGEVGGRRFARVPGHVENLAFNSSGETLIALDGLSEILRWDAASGRLVGVRDGTDKIASYNQAVFSSDGEMLASSTKPGTVSLTDVSTGHVRTLRTGKRRRIHQLVFSQGGDRLAVATEDERIVIFDLSTRNRTNVQSHGDRSVRALSFSSDGLKLAAAYEDSGSATTVSLFYADTGGRVTGGSFDALAVWPDFPFGLSGSIAFSPDDLTLSTPGGAGVILRWDTENSRPLGQVLSSGQGIAAVSLDGTIKALARNGHIVLTDVDTGQLLGQIDVGSGVQALTFAPDGSLLAATYADGPPDIWIISDGQQSVEAPALPSDHTFVGFGPDANTVALGSKRGIILWDASLGARRGTLLPAKSGRAHWLEVAFDSDGTMVAVGDQKGIRLYAADSGDLIRDLGVRGSPPASYFSLSIIDGTFPRPFPDFKLLPTQDQAMAFSPDNRVLVMGTQEAGTTLILTDVGSGNPIEPITGQADAGTVIAVSPDGNLVVSGLDRSLTLWDMETRQPIGTIPAGGGTFDDLFFSSADSLFSVSQATVIRWDLRVSAWTRRGCQIAGRNLTEEEWKLFMGDDVVYQRTCPDAG